MPLAINVDRTFSLLCLPSILAIAGDRRYVVQADTGATVFSGSGKRTHR